MENKHYQLWTQEELNHRIIALYDKIENVTLENLEVAQKNCELQIQIKTIDEIIKNYTGRPTNSVSSTNRNSQRLQNKYENLLQDHKKLIKRVNKIEEALFSGSNKKTPSVSTKDYEQNLNRVSSIQDLVVKTHRRSTTNAKSSLRDSRQKITRPQNNTKRPKYL